MIVCPKRGFVFVHVPKCAGSSVRSQIKRCDDSHISLGDVGAHPTLGRIDYGHIPLAQLREHFPDHYAYVRDLPAFAIVREPLDRFGSALRQVLWRYEQRPMTLIPRDELRDITLRLLDEIDVEIDAPSHRLIFFARQESFICDGDRRLVNHVIPMDLVPAFIDHIGRRTGVPLDSGARANQNVDLRFKGLGELAYKINGVLRKTIPADFHARLKDAALSVLASGRSAAEASGILDLPEVRAFVTERYARDREIHRAAGRDAVRLRAALEGDTLEWRAPPAPGGAPVLRRDERVEPVGNVLPPRSR